MQTHPKITEELVAAGYLSEADMAAADAILTAHLEVTDAEETIAFAEEDIVYQAQVVEKAEELADIDLEMGDIQDRFVQAEVINSAASLAEKDAYLIKLAEDEISAASEKAAAALLAAKLIDEANLGDIIEIFRNKFETNNDSSNE